MSDISLYRGDCLEIMKGIPDKCVDLVLCDPPYGTTDNDWDSVIDIDAMWGHLKRLTRSGGAILLFGQPPFSTRLIASNIKMFRYEWIWVKSQAVGFFNANKMPLRATENISVFYESLPTYNPQKEWTGKAYYKRGGGIIRSKNYGNKARVGGSSDGMRYPSNVLYFSSEDHTNMLHPTQKSLDLCEYLIRTYTNKGDTVLDFAMGSGTTGAASRRLGRKFIGIEKDEEYFSIASRRIHDTTKDLF